jgi:hypothetical protein
MHELPRREIERTKIEPEYRKKEIEFKQNRRLQNTRRWTGVLKEKTNLSEHDIQQNSAQFRQTTADLKSLAKFDGGGIAAHRAAESWKQLTRRGSGDLAGLWNDVKQELASRSKGNGSVADARLNNALDLLEIAEREGGLSTWLDQWNQMFHESKMGWDALTESIDNIKQGIAFCREMALEGFGNISNLGADVLNNRTDLVFALDAIALEIVSQAERYRNGTMLHPDPFDGIRERLTGVSPRASIKEQVASNLKSGTLEKTWAYELPDAIRKNSDITGLSTSLRDWQDKATELNGVLNTEHQEGDEVRAAKDLADATMQAWRDADRLAKVATTSTFGHHPDDISLAMSMYDRLIRELVSNQREALKRVRTQLTHLATGLTACG